MLLSFEPIAVGTLVASFSGMNTACRIRRAPWLCRKIPTKSEKNAWLMKTWSLKMVNSLKIPTFSDSGTEKNTCFETWPTWTCSLALVGYSHGQKYSTICKAPKSRFSGPKVEKQTFELLIFLHLESGATIFGFTLLVVGEVQLTYVFVRYVVLNRSKLSHVERTILSTSPQPWLLFLLLGGHCGLYMVLFLYISFIITALLLSLQ